MKKIIFLIAILFEAGLNSSQAQNAWTKKADFGGIARATAVGFTISNKGYIGTGGDASGSKKDFWEYDPANNAWTQKADFGGTARSWAVGFSIGNKGYLGLGDDINGKKKDFWEYDPTANDWMQKADFGGTARGGPVGFSIGGKGYVGTGEDAYGNYDTKDFWEYDPGSDSWTRKADFGGLAVKNATGFSIGSKGYIGTGFTLSGSFTTEFWEYNPATNVWTQKANFGGTARIGSVGFSIDDKGYVCSGGPNGENNNDLWEYDPVIDNWTQKANFGGSPRRFLAGFSINSKGYIGTGLDLNNNFKKDFWEYTPAAAPNTWTQKANFGGVAREGAIGISISGKGYIGLGAQYPVSYKDFWEYNPATNAWTQKADFGGSARLYATRFSISGKGYVGTGQSGTYPNYTYYKDFWEYDPVSNNWTQKKNFGGTARYGAVGFSINGKGYLGTGSDALNGYKKDFWEFDPIQNIWTQKKDFGGAGRKWATGFSIEGKGYLGTGSGTDSTLKDFWEYDPSIDLWTQKSDFGGAARIQAVGIRIGNKGYIGTGQPLSKDFWEYNPLNDTWKQKADFGGTARGQATGFSIVNTGYIGTGFGQSYKKDFWMYTPEVCNSITVYTDADGDGYGDAENNTIADSCDLPDGYVLDSTDCNDANASIHPFAKEVCNGIDDNCNGRIDEITGLSTTNITATKAQFNWHTLKGSVFYIIKYKLADPNISSWSTISVNAPIVSVTVSQLNPNSKYLWKIASNCGTLGNTAYSGPVKFTTAAAVSAGKLTEESIKAAGTIVLVYPNPVTDVLYLDNLKSKATISILTQDGRMVDKKIVSNGTHEWNVKKLAAGSYYMKIEEGTKISILKFIKQ